jgi:hypothetical protein
MVAKFRLKKFRPTDAQPGDFVSVVSDEATPAGILSSLKGCTRLLSPDEGDEVFRDLGLTQSYSQGSRSQTSFTNARAKLTSLYDRPQEFVRQLKGQEVKVDMNAKLNILVVHRLLSCLARWSALGCLFWQLHRCCVGTENDQRIV